MTHVDDLFQEIRQIEDDRHAGSKRIQQIKSEICHQISVTEGLRKGDIISLRGTAIKIESFHLESYGDDMFLVFAVGPKILASGKPGHFNSEMPINGKRERPVKI